MRRSNIRLINQNKKVTTLDSSSNDSFMYQEENQVWKEASESPNRNTTSCVILPRRNPHFSFPSRAAVEQNPARHGNPRGILVQSIVKRC